MLECGESRSLGGSQGTAELSLRGQPEKAGHAGPGSVARADGLSGDVTLESQSPRAILCRAQIARREELPCGMVRGPFWHEPPGRKMAKLEGGGLPACRDLGEHGGADG